ncbi:N(6)-adenine-specific DNA methyltransferase 2 [Trichinella pseudospiralis]|uniref:N(6)-adenine-specific DNA methyltransferase 2 n=1 Tax=Trichinella pseudospiralis TaxID=6337 RepID=A0A0V1IKA5_TRIPS|nr:N(6)-adenine-specific DNA methyltransferase 2 [Trichinella pseudospiralis]KRZ23047.1 N(6)-adenine-specific DNA methyltransferase 2 [Trichinella pseudospiralis]KRZ36728.1 N(6)-adenine-specific DNA methyltransferase 2 [Trichinella pseudospiralis]
MSSDDEMCLSEEALQCLKAINFAKALDSETSVDENWQLSQFWYDENTSLVLAKECLSALKNTDLKVGCLCSPSVYDKLVEICPEKEDQFLLFEFDKRFKQFNRNFIFYDYQSPETVPCKLANSCAIVLADPPFLSEECLSKVVAMAKFLSTGKIIVSTGIIMESYLSNLLPNVSKCNFTPQHERKLGNEFGCFVNYETVYLNTVRDVCPSESWH